MSKLIPVNIIEGEIWYPLPDFEGLYEISSLHRFKSLKRQIGLMPNGSIRIWKERMCVGGIDAYGYHVFNFRDRDHNKVMKKMHRMIAEKFIPNPYNKPEVNHKNGIKTDNRIDNLEWATQSENMQHAKDTGLNKVIGEGCNFAKIKKEEAIFIFKSNLSNKQLSEKFSLSPKTIYLIKKKKLWKRETMNL